MTTRSVESKEMHFWLNRQEVNLFGFQLHCKHNIDLYFSSRNVGKTSLILSLVSEEFPIDVPAR